MAFDKKSILDQYDWLNIGKRLAVYASWKMKRLTWSDSNLLQGETPEDMAINAIESLFDGTRNWNPEKVPDIEYFLKRVIDSRISHLWDSKHRQKNVDLVQKIKGSQNLKDEELKEQATHDPFDSLLLTSEQTVTPETQLISEEQRRSDEKVLNKIIDAVNGDSELEKILDCFLKGICKTDEMASATGIQKNRIYELRRKLKDKANRTLGTNRGLETAQEESHE